jgi:hypothetical protein
MTDKGFYADSRTNYQISHCYVHNIKIPFHLVGADSGVIEYCYAGPSWGKEAIRGMSSANNWTVRYNRFVNTCFDDPNDPTANGATADIAAWGDGPGPFDNWEIYGNIFWNTPGTAIDHSDAIILGGYTGGGAGNIANNWKVYNNILTGISGTGLSQATINITGSNNQVYNNIWYRFSTNSNVGCIAGSCQNNWCYGSSKCSALNIVGQSDPFVDAVNGDFHLKNPAQTTGPSPVNAGRNPGAGFDAIDVDGNTRGADGTWDIGAYEYITTAIRWMENAEAPGTASACPNPLKEATLKGYMQSRRNMRVYNLAGQAYAAARLPQDGMCVIYNQTNRDFQKVMVVR